MADEAGTVLEVTNRRVKVQYKDGKEETFKIGTNYTNYEGVDYNNILVTDLKQGDKFKEGDNIFYHKDFFERDWLNPDRLILKYNRTYRVALVSDPSTYEDSCAVSKRVKMELTTSMLRERKFTLDFSKNIDNLVQIGQEVTPNSTLFVDSGDGYDAGNLSSTALSTLEALASLSPRAEYKGVVDSISIKYNGDVSDMTPSLAKLANKLDKQLWEETKGTTYEAKNNKVTGEYTSSGKKLNIDEIEIKIFIRVEGETAVGDKVVFANQAKTVVGEVFEYDMIGTESGETVDATIASVSFIYRVIESPYLLGTTARLSSLYTKELVKAYFG